MSLSWDEMRDHLMARVFHGYSADEVAESADLTGDGYLTSTSVLVLLGMIDDEAGGGNGLTDVRPSDTATLADIEALYTRLLRQ